MVGMANVLTAWLLQRLYLPPTRYHDTDGYLLGLYLPAFLLGWLVGLPILTALEGMVAMLYVCFAESPEEISKREPDLYVELADQWMLAKVRLYISIYIQHKMLCHITSACVSRRKKNVYMCIASPLIRQGPHPGLPSSSSFSHPSLPIRLSSTLTTFCLLFTGGL
jgi:hypothetical protein